VTASRRGRASTAGLFDRHAPAPAWQAGRLNFIRREGGASPT
jgi:hypothetical protein